MTATLCILGAHTSPRCWDESELLSLCFAPEGLDADGEEETLLGTFMYNVAKEPIQTFPLKALPRAFSYVKFLVKSNWGNPKYTCIYRVRVHGKMAKPESLS
ncbi:hypothetical protein Q9233_009069 [Columba guinea]|nr:hypothetical protein Q9233_009069 [Columba guinea]